MSFKNCNREGFDFGDRDGASASVASIAPDRACGPAGDIAARKERYAASPGRVQWAVGRGARSALLAAAVLLSAWAPLQAQPATAPRASAKPAVAAPAAKAARTVLFMGDSLSAGYGLAASQGWVALTAERIAKTKPGWKVVNASISGETTAGGASRIAGELQRNRPAVVVIELGANDGLRGLPVPTA